MNRCRTFAVVGLVLVLLFAPIASGLVGATSAQSSLRTVSETRGLTATTQEISSVSIVETNVTSGTSFEYDLGEYDRIENYAIELTGAVSREDDVDRGTISSDGDSIPLSVAGTMAPTGPANGKPELTLTAETETQSSEYRQGNSLVALYGKSHSEIRIVRPPQSISTIRTYHETTGGSGAVVDVYIVDGEDPDASYREGTLVKEGWEVPNSKGWQTIDIEEYRPSNSTITVAFVTVEEASESFGTPVDPRRQDEQVRASWAGNLMSTPFPLEVVSAPPSDVSVTADDGTTVSFGSFEPGESSKSQPIDLSQNATELTVNYAGGDTIEWSLAYTERTESVNPAVSVNGNQQNVSRTLADGETVSLTPEQSWVQQGTNTVVVTVGGDSLSSDAPAPVVNLRYTHDTVTEPTPTPTPTPTPPSSDDADDDDASGGGGGGGSAPASSDDDDDDDSNDDSSDDSDDDSSDDSDDDSSDDSDRRSSGGSSGGGSSGGSAGSGSSGGGIASSSDSDDADAPEEPSASPTATTTPTPVSPSPTATEVSTGGQPAETFVADVSFQPRRISTNVQAVAVVRVRNPQTVADTYTVELSVEGETIATREVTVPPESDTVVQFSFSLPNPGTYTAEVDGETATVTVVEPEEGVQSTSTQFPGFTPLTVLLAVLALWLFVRRR